MIKFQLLARLSLLPLEICAKTSALHLSSGNQDGTIASCFPPSIHLFLKSEASFNEVQDLTQFALSIYKAYCT